MALFNRSKKEKEQVAVQEEKKAPKKKSAAKSARAFPVEGVLLRSPHITEKGAYLAEHRAYAFRVAKEANKVAIRKAIESFYGVNVESVRMMNVPSKARRRGRIMGTKKGYKKAIVRVKEGQKIDITS